MNLLLNLLIFFGFLSHQVVAQNDAQYEVLRTVLEHELKASNSPLFLGCHKSRTVFDPKVLLEESGLLLSEHILDDLKQDAGQSKTGRWDRKSLKTILVEDIELQKVCLSPKAIENKFRSTGKRQNIILVSQPIFDRNFNYCVVQIVYQKFFKSAYGGSYLLKRNPTGWEIIAEFEYWMS
jgi:hypothetical protein